MINKILDYFKGVWKEVLRVIWPDNKKVLNHTIIVVVAVAVGIGLVSAIDYGLSTAIGYFISLK